jgi:phosphate transport system ATP-binding protein
MSQADSAAETRDMKDTESPEGDKQPIAIQQLDLGSTGPILSEEQLVGDPRNIMVHAEPVIETRDLNIYYAQAKTIHGISLTVPRERITALIGPSGSGKSTLLRAFNRMNDVIPIAWNEGQVLFDGEDLYAAEVDPVEVRRRIGMVFQKPNPFPKSIFDNVAFGLRINRYKGNLADRVEEALRGAALWDEVKDRLKDNAYGLSGGQQQRLCIARALAVEPDVILMDEPASALDPIATGRIEELMQELKQNYTIIIVTHNMQQAARVADYTAFMNLGRLIEYGDTHKIFTGPDDERTEAYITGRFG